jgi:threonine dehydrogenase-like Zn-dependent dehydrogenase
MKAVVFHDVGDIRVENVPEPKIEQPTDAIVHLSASAICGTDLHMVRGSLPGMKPGTVKPEKILTKIEPMTHVLSAYKAFDQRQPGWMKVALEPVLVA